MNTEAKAEAVAKPRAECGQHAADGKGESDRGKMLDELGHPVSRLRDVAPMLSP